MEGKWLLVIPVSHIPLKHNAMLVLHTHNSRFYLNDMKILSYPYTDHQFHTATFSLEVEAWSSPYPWHFRVAKQRLQEARMLALDYLILLLAGACLGSLIKANDQNFGEDAYIYTIIAVCKSHYSQLTAWYDFLWIALLIYTNIYIYISSGTYLIWEIWIIVSQLNNKLRSLFVLKSAKQ